MPGKGNRYVPGVSIGKIWSESVHASDHFDPDPGTKHILVLSKACMDPFGRLGDGVLQQLQETAEHISAAASAREYHRIEPCAWLFDYEMSSTLVMSVESGVGRTVSDVLKMTWGIACALAPCEYTLEYKRVLGKQCAHSLYSRAIAGWHLVEISWITNVPRRSTEYISRVPEFKRLRNKKKYSRMRDPE